MKQRLGDYGKTVMGDEPPPVGSFSSLAEAVGGAGRTIQRRTQQAAGRAASTGGFVDRTDTRPGRPGEPATAIP